MHGGVSLSSHQIVQPIIRRLDLTRSFQDLALHIDRQLSKLIGTPSSFAVFTERLLERIIIGAVIMGEHDVFSCMGRLGLIDGMDPREL